jgi:dihydrolipoamide dehydrogenase
LKEFDLIVVGSGSGLDIANAAASQGLKVAIVEKSRLGGTCLNRGCIPSKLLIHSADIIETIKKAHMFGIKVSGLSIDFQKIMSRANGITDTESDEIKKGLVHSSNPKLFANECKFIGEKKIALMSEDKKDNGDVITAEKIVIATGAKPKIPKIDGLEESGFITSDEALRLRRQPRVLTFIGGGYIACELAHFFGSLGTKINIIQKNSLLVPHEDKEIAEKLTGIFGKKFNVHLGCNPRAVLKIKGSVDGSSNSHNGTINGNNETLRVIATTPDGNTIKVDSDQLIVSIGREPNTLTLDLEKTGVRVSERGFIKVDEYLETTNKGVFAIGDAVGRYQFKHSANLEAQYAYNNLMGNNEKMAVDYTAMPRAIFSSPQVAGVGFTEQELIEKGMDYLKSSYPYIKTGMGQAIEDKEGFVKFLVNRKDRKILGCHILGTDASILIHEVLVAMRSGDNTVDNILYTVHIHPSLSEVIARGAGSI